MCGIVATIGYHKNDVDQMLEKISHRGRDNRGRDNRGRDNRSRDNRRDDRKPREDKKED